MLSDSRIMLGVEGVTVIDNDSSELVARTLSLLDSVVLPEFYGPPCRLDDVLAALLGALAEGAPAERDGVAGALTEQRRRVLARYAMRAPMLALRTETPHHLFAGLVANCLIERTTRDPRDDMIFFAPYTHVARELGVNPTELFDSAAAYAAPDLANDMRVFGRRTDVTLRVFGWRQIDTPDGPSFEMVHMGGAPSGAVAGERSWDEVNQALAEKLLAWVREQRQEYGQGGEA